MKIDVKSLVSISEANQNFSKVARLVDEKGVAVILKNNRPRYVILEYAQFMEEEFSDNETVETVAHRLVARHIKAFRELAK